jgi:hypothetical protein
MNNMYMSVDRETVGCTHASPGRARRSQHRSFGFLMLMAAMLAGTGILPGAGLGAIARAEAPPGGFEETKELRTPEGPSGFLTFSMGPEGDWEFSGDVYNAQDEDFDYYATCYVRSSVGEIFQMSVAGTLEGYGSDSTWPQPGKPAVAGRNPEIAAHWSEVNIDASWDCTLGAEKHKDGGPDLSKVIDVGGRVVGAVSSIILLCVAIF